METILDFTDSNNGIFGKTVSLQEAVRNNSAYLPDQDIMLPELQYNLHKLVKDTEVEIFTLNSKYSHISNDLLLKTKTGDDLLRKRNYEFDQINRNEDLLKMIDDLIERSSSFDSEKIVKSSTGTDMKPLELDEFANIIEKIQNKYRYEYVQYNLCSLAFSIVSPLLKKKLSSWNPIEEYEEVEKCLVRWRFLLSGSVISDDNDDRDYIEHQKQDVYTELIELIIVPKLQKFLTNY